MFNSCLISHVPYTPLYILFFEESGNINVKSSPSQLATGIFKPRYAPIE